MSERLNVGFWIPAYNGRVHGNIASQMCQDISTLSARGYGYHFWWAHSCDLVWLRNRHLHQGLVQGTERAVGEFAKYRTYPRLDFMAMQDADNYAPMQGGPLATMIDTAKETGATVVTAIVTMRTRPPRANVWPCYPGEVYEADKTGTGLILIDLNRLRDWYFEYEGPCFFRTYDTDKGVKQKVGLDIFFSYVVREHGGLIACDARIPTTHVDALFEHQYDGRDVPGEELVSKFADPAAETGVATGA